jgi:hypothetical protein
MRRSLFIAVVLVLAGCGGDDDGGGGGGGGSEEGGVVTFMLEEMNDSGKSGTAELHSSAASTDVTIELEPARGDNEPIHVHQGTCDEPAAEVAHDVGFTTAGLGQGQIFVTIDQVTTGEFVLDIHSASNPDEVIMCGAIPEQ